MTNGGPILWNGVPICETFKISWQMGKHLTNGGSENHSSVIPFGYDFCKDQLRLHQFGKKVLPEIYEDTH